MLTFILGGARSGKSEYAERRAAASTAGVTYIATAQETDPEMRTRIAAHRQRRPAGWETLEIPVGVGRRMLAAPPRNSVILLECLTLLVSNRLLQASPQAGEEVDAAARHAVEEELAALLEAIETIDAHWLVVSNEVGQGIVPAYPLGRVFRDLLGWANKQLALRADEVVWMVAGIPVPVTQYRLPRTA